MINVNGIEKTASEWADTHKIKPSTITSRKRKGYSDEVCLSTVSLKTNKSIETVENDGLI